MAVTTLRSSDISLLFQEFLWEIVIGISSKIYQDYLKVCKGCQSSAGDLITFTLRFHTTFLISKANNTTKSEVPKQL